VFLLLHGNADNTPVIGELVSGMAGTRVGVFAHRHRGVWRSAGRRARGTYLDAQAGISGCGKEGLPPPTSIRWEIPAAQAASELARAKRSAAHPAKYLHQYAEAGATYSRGSVRWLQTDPLRTCSSCPGSQCPCFVAHSRTTK